MKSMWVYLWKRNRFCCYEEWWKIYIQVSDNIENENTLIREISPLLSIRDGYKKMIITRLNHEGYINEGIEIIDISDWLMNDKI